MEHLRLLRRRPVLVLWLAQSLSVLGDRLYALAVMWVVYAATGSASLMGLVAVAESLPYIVLGTVGRLSRLPLLLVPGTRMGRRGAGSGRGRAAVPVVARRARHRSAARRCAAPRHARGTLRSQPRRPRARSRRARASAADHWSPRPHGPHRPYRRSGQHRPTTALRLRGAALRPEWRDVRRVRRGAALAGSPLRDLGRMKLPSALRAGRGPPSRRGRCCVSTRGSDWRSACTE